MSLKIYIPTRERPFKQVTSNLLSEAQIKHYLVTEDGSLQYDVDRYYAKFILVPPMKLNEKRQYILLNAKKHKFIMFDDDLMFRKREEYGEKVSYKRTGPTGVKILLRTIEHLLHTYAHVGVTDEFMCNTRPPGYMRGARYNGVLAYNPKLFKKDVSFRLELNHDHDVALQLYAQGLPPAIITDFTKSTKFQAKGGLHDFRTVERELQGHHKLAKLWPDLVKVVPSKTSRCGYRLSVNWRKAMQQCPS